MIGFVLGMGVGAAQGVLHPLSLWWALTILLVAIVLLLYRWRVGSREAFILALILLGFALGSWRGEMVRVPAPLSLPFNTTTSFTARVDAPADERESFTYLTVLPQGESSRVRVRVPSYPLYHYCDVLSIKGILTEPRPFLTDQGATFDYPSYLAREKIVAEMTAKEVKLVTPAPFSLRGSLYAFVDMLRASVSRVIPEPAAALGSGMLLGGSNALGKDLSNTFRLAGLSHIVVLSGYNVTIISEFLLRLLSPFARTLRLGGAGLGIILFVVATGGSASALRAGLMALTLLVAKATGREYDAVRALSVATGAMILFNPLTLTADPGFQLSVAATLGLIFFSTPLELRLARFIRIRFIREALATTLAAQVAVLPLILHLSGILSLVSIPLNVLVFPLVPLTMELTAISAFLALIAVPLAFPSAFLATLLLRFIIVMTQLATSLPLSAFPLPIPSMPFVLTIYALAALALYWRYKIHHVATPA